MEGNLIKILTASGLAGVAIFAIYILWDITGNHINHSTRALIKLETSINNIDDTMKTQTDVMRSLERIIELKIR